MTRGPFRLGRRLGRGATSRVWRGIAPDGTRAAVKVFAEARDAAGRRRVETEAAFLARLRHPLVPRMLWAGDDAIAMELVAGQPIDRALTRPVAPADLVALLLDVLDVLDHAHGLGIVHRDLKPANILIRRVRLLPRDVGSRAHVVDFGLAVDRCDDLVAPARLAGTPRTMSPEQRAGLAVDARSDLYAVGAVARELLGEAIEPFDRFLRDDPAGRPASAARAIDLLVERFGDGGSPLARPGPGLARQDALRFALGTARLPDALVRAAPARSLGDWLVRQRDAGRLTRAGRRWGFVADVRTGDGLRAGGRAREAIAAYLAEGRIAAAAELHCLRQEYDAALGLLDSLPRRKLSDEIRLVRGLTLAEMGRDREALGWLSRVRRSARGALRARAAASEGRVEERLGRLDRAVSRYREALRIAGRLGDRRGESQARLRLGELALRGGDLREAERMLRRGVATARAAGELDLLAPLLVGLGLVAERLGRLEETGESHATALELYRRIGDRRGAFACLANLGSLAALEGRVGEARASYAAAVELATELGDALRLGGALANLSHLELLACRPEEARAAGDAAVAALERAERAPPAHVAVALHNRAAARAATGPDRDGGAEADLLRARDLARGAGAEETAIECEIGLARLEADRGFLVQAGERIEKARRDAAARGLVELTIRADTALAAVLNRAGLHAEALDLAGRADRAALAARAGILRLAAIAESAAALEGLGRKADAEALRAALERGRESLG